MAIGRNFIILCLLFLTALPVFAAHLEIGQKPPDFRLQDQYGTYHRLSDSLGHVTVLAFYPADFTSGCTCEMKSLRDNLSKLKANGVTVYGISVDTAASHTAFAKSLGLQFPILADPDKTVTQAYGVLGSNGRAERVTFIISKQGKIAGIDRSVNAQFGNVDGVMISRHGQDLALLLSKWNARIGGVIPNFSLPAPDGSTTALQKMGAKGSVVLFLSVKCPVCKAYLSRLKALASSPEFSDIHFIGLDPDADETNAQITSFHRKEALPFPIAKDTGNYLADRFGASHTPEVWVVNGEGIAIYHGAIDDNADAAKVTQNYLADTLRAMLAGKPISQSDTYSVGCAIRRVKKG
jgi:peroxiredoxin Q/BCP